MRRADDVRARVQRGAPGDADHRAAPPDVGGRAGARPVPDDEPVRRRRAALPAPRHLVLVLGEAEPQGRVARSSWSSAASTPPSRSSTWSPTCSASSTRTASAAGVSSIRQGGRPHHEAPGCRPARRDGGRALRRRVRPAARGRSSRTTRCTPRCSSPTSPASGMDACYHHLYEYGTIGIFGVIGRPTTDPGSPTSGPDRRRTMTLRWTFDERVEDGLVAGYALKRFKQMLEDPVAAGLLPADRPVAARRATAAPTAAQSGAAVGHRRLPFRPLRCCDPGRRGMRSGAQCRGRSVGERGRREAPDELLPRPPRGVPAPRRLPAGQGRGLLAVLQDGRERVAPRFTHRGPASTSTSAPTTT